MLEIEIRGAAETFAYSYLLWGKTFHIPLLDSEFGFTFVINNPRYGSEVFIGRRGQRSCHAERFDLVDENKYY